ncbi:hypothetical protein LCGC14_2295230, partial [marine sediment metagenome]
PGVYSLGLDYYKDHFYCVGSSSKSLHKLDSNWKVVKKVIITDLDAHGVDCFDDKVVVTNPSGIHMEIFDTDLNLLEHIPIPLYEKAIHDNVFRHHINCAQMDSNKSIYYSVTFMPQTDSPYHINRRDDGHIMKIVDGQHISVVSGLYLPHSLQIKDDYLYVCNKKEYSVDKYTLDGELVSSTGPLLDGWIRGLCPLDDDIWLVGLNSARCDSLPIDRKKVGILVLKEYDDRWKSLINLIYHFQKYLIS